MYNEMITNLVWGDTGIHAASEANTLNQTGSEKRVLEIKVDSMDETFDHVSYHSHLGQYCDNYYPPYEM